MKKTIIIALLLIAMTTTSFATKYVVNTEKWDKWGTDYIVDIGPYTSNGKLKFMIHFFNSTWATCELASIVTDSDLRAFLPGVNEYGTMYRSKDKTQWMWIADTQKTHELKVSKTRQLKASTPVTTPTPTPVTTSAPVVVLKAKEVSVENDYTWTRADKLPTLDVVVIIQFKNGTTTTAYIKDVKGSKEWKQDMNKGQYRGGRTLTDVVKWRETGI